jgi:lipopolysaccharide export system protein LptA
MNLARVSKGSFIVFFLLLTSSCFALPDDRVQTMQFRADSADLNHQTHRGVYIGDVQLDQGSTHIRAAKAVTEGNLKNQLVKAIIKGNKEAQAHYWTLTTADKPPMHAYADIIYYYPEKHSIELIGNAKVEQGNDSFSASKISYDTLHHLVVSKNDSKTRTTIIIHPGKTP